MATTNVNDIEMVLDGLNPATVTGDIWLSIGMALGVTKQAAQKRFSR